MFKLHARFSKKYKYSFYKGIKQCVNVGARGNLKEAHNKLYREIAVSLSLFIGPPSWEVL